MHTPDKDARNAFPRRVLPTLASLATGSAFGWFFRVDLLKLLVDPWVNPNTISEGYPSPTEVSVWFSLIAATVGILLALPWLTVLAWGVTVPRSRPINGRSSCAFVLSSYAAIGSALCLAAFVVFPAFQLRQHEAWQGMAPVPWAYIELELRGTVGFALASQVCVVLFALALRGLVRREQTVRRM